MFKRAFAGNEKALGAEHTSTLDTVNKSRISVQRSTAISPMRRRCTSVALAGYERVLGAEHMSNSHGQ